MLRMLRCGTLAVGAAALLVPVAARAQGGSNTPPAIRQAAQLDREGKTQEARTLLLGALDSTSDPALKAQLNRTIAMSYAFDGDCANTLKYEQLVIDYWKTREAAEPQEAFYQQGEMANEGARVCIDAGDIDRAEQWYRKGYELGMKEPAPRTHAASLWDYRLAHALGRIAARRGDKAEAQRQIAAARRALDSDTAMARGQERFYPYLTGYVALYTNDLQKAEQELTKALAMRGNDRDPFMRYLLGMTYEKLGRADDAKAAYLQAQELATAHNPPAAYVVRITRITKP